MLPDNLGQLIRWGMDFLGRLIFTVTWSLKIPYREQRELMEELNRPPEFNLSIFDAANLKLFESESKNEIFYEIIPFIVQSRKSCKIVIFVIAEKLWQFSNHNFWVYLQLGIKADPNYFFWIILFVIGSFIGLHFTRMAKIIHNYICF